MNSAELARKIRILEIKIDMATKAELSMRKADRAASAASTTAMLNELGSLYKAAR